MQEKDQKMGIGIVIRDCHVEVLACLCSSKSFHSQPIVAEFWALWRALILCTELGLENVHLEGDAQGLISAINSEEIMCCMVREPGGSSKEVYQGKRQLEHLLCA